MSRSSPRHRLIALLSGNETPAALGPREWTHTLSVARSANLLGSLAAKVRESGSSAGCGADRHLDGALQLSLRQQRSVRWEAQCLSDALRTLGVPVVLLKGAAYVMGNHPNAHGRLFGDIDLLVASKYIGDVEVRLMVAGWNSGKLDPYDQRYYRQWMHEIPPLVHIKRGTVLDVHHTILPPTAGHATQPDEIIARSSPLPDLPGLHVPCVEDLVIHSLTHLVHEGEVDHCLRDLYDIHVLVTRYGGDPAFWGRLVHHTMNHDLAGPVALGLRLASLFFATPMPASIAAELAIERHGKWLAPIYDRALHLTPDHTTTIACELAKLALYVRSHALRMPPGMLVRHLARKAWTRAAAHHQHDPVDQ